MEENHLVKHQISLYKKFKKFYLVIKTNLSGSQTHKLVNFVKIKGARELGHNKPFFKKLY
jgi:hypothetical protein